MLMPLKLMRFGIATAIYRLRCTCLISLESIMFSDVMYFKECTWGQSSSVESGARQCFGMSPLSLYIKSYLVTISERTRSRTAPQWRAGKWPRPVQVSVRWHQVLWTTFPTYNWLFIVMPKPSTRPRMPCHLIVYLHPWANEGVEVRVYWVRAHDDVRHIASAQLVLY